MNFRPITRLALLAAVLLGQVANQATADQPKADPAQELATQATGILRKYCHRCHGVQFKVPAYDVLKRDILVAPREGADPYITPGKPEKSELWDRMGSAEPQTGDAMPLSGPKPTDADKDIIKKWIVAGAPFPKATSRTPVRDQDIVKAMVDHLRGLDDGERRFWRYFTLATLYNNPSVRDDELRLARAGRLEAAQQSLPAPQDRRARCSRAWSDNYGRRHPPPGLAGTRCLVGDLAGLSLRPEIQ